MRENSSLETPLEIFEQWLESHPAPVILTEKRIIVLSTPEIIKEYNSVLRLALQKKMLFKQVRIWGKLTIESKVLLTSWLEANRNEDVESDLRRRCASLIRAIGDDWKFLRAAIIFVGRIEGTIDKVLVVAVNDRPFEDAIRCCQSSNLMMSRSSFFRYEELWNGLADC